MIDEPISVKTYKKIKNFFELWWAGAITLIPIALMLLGAKTFSDIFIGVFAAFIYMMFIILIPVITSLFILKKIPEE